jgi:hypothetical protein
MHLVILCIRYKRGHLEESRRRNSSRNFFIVYSREHMNLSKTHKPVSMPVQIQYNEECQERMFTILNMPQPAVLTYCSYAFQLHRSACKGSTGWDGSGCTGEGWMGLKNAAESSFLCLWTAGDACLPPRLMQLMNTLSARTETLREAYMGLQKLGLCCIFLHRAV